MTSQTLFLVVLISVINMLNVNADQPMDRGDFVPLDKIKMLEFHHERYTLGYDPKIQLECVKTKYCDGHKALFMRCEKRNTSTEDYLDISSWSCSSVFDESHVSQQLEVFGMKISCETIRKINHTSLSTTPLDAFPKSTTGAESILILKDSCSMRYSLRKRTASDYDRYLITKALAYCIFFFIFLTVCCFIAYKTKNVDEIRAARAERNQMQVFCIANSRNRTSSAEETANKIEDDLPPSYSVLFDNVNSDVAVNVAGHGSNGRH